ncbi:MULTISPECIES: acetate/propionate family kinase [Thiorhodovibrio]|uniref:acetate/propionate family kinase n=1 Tax=Thiorhodovibrio TaxID=61593 RepID=UPI0019112D66|nr:MULTISPECIES: acetate kinase [Thiorhodovibrio]MBK5970298.1 acetate kinase [Thiorhodovibrio winogradskyi]WPL13737.1 Acetate kinase [Thiorhodovibrio litoralis]
MKVLVLNAGSSSLKFQLFEIDGWPVVASGNISRIGEDDALLNFRWQDESGQTQTLDEHHPIDSHHTALERIVAHLRDTGALADLAELKAIGHRVVHGGEAFHLPTLIDDDVIVAIRQMIPLAPLHNPAHLDGILVARELFPGVPEVAVFDTAFHQTMPRTAYRYAIPDYLYREHQVRRYGFHGTSHAYVGKRAATMLGRSFERSNLITLHLGNGASATAIRNGSSVDTSMGMTPLEGLVMGSRCGDIDPAVVFYLAKHLGLDNQQIDDMLNRQSGLLGICGLNDMREIHRMIENGDNKAELALGMSCHRLKKYIGAYTAVLGEVHAVVFTGGIGENDAETRARACGGLERMGIVLDEAANRSSARGERMISTADSPVKVLVIPTNEELEIAQQTVEAVG